MSVGVVIVEEWDIVVELERTALDVPRLELVDELGVASEHSRDIVLCPLSSMRVSHLARIWN